MTEIKSGNDCVIGQYSGEAFTVLIYCPKPAEIYAEAKDGGHAGSSRLLKYDSTTEYAGSDTKRHKIVIDAPNKRADMYDDKGNPEAYLNFPSSGTSKWTYNNTSKFPLLFFGSSKDVNGTPLQCVKAKIYGVKIWETENGKETLLHEYVPAEKYGYAGFYDTVDNQFFGQQETSGTLLTYGGDVMSLGEDDSPYVESDGSSFWGAVDTRYFPNSKTKVEVDFRQMELRTNHDCVFGHYASDYTLLLYGPVNGTPLAGKYKLVAKDDTYGNGTDLISVDTRRHTAMIDVPNRHVEMRAPDGDVQAQANLSTKSTYNFTNVTCPLALFGSSADAYGKTLKGRGVKARIYSAKIWENENADGSGKWIEKHIFLPCVKEGVVGFKDQVTGMFVSGENLTAGGNVPKETETDPYIDTGTSGMAISFDTGYYVTANTRIVCDFMPLKQQNGQQFPFEAGDGVSATNGNEKSYMRMYGNGSTGEGSFSYCCGKQLMIDASVAYKPNIRRKLTLDAYKGKFKIETNGEVLRDMTLADTCRNPNPSSTTLKILSNANGNGYYCMARLYSFQIYEKDVCVRDYRPYVKGGVVGLRYVEGDGGFITASNAANALKLKCGGAIEIEGRTDAYIENDGKTTLNLGYKAKTSSRIECDYQWLSLAKSTVICGAWNDYVTGIRYCCWNNNGNSGKIQFIFDGNSKAQQSTPDIIADLKRHTAVMDMKNRQLAYVTDGITNSVAVNSEANLTNSPDCSHEMGVFGGIPYNESMTSYARVYAVRIYEDNELKHEFLPYKNGEVVSLRDTKTGYVATKTAKSGVTPAWPTIGGKGVDGAEKWIVEPQAAVTLTKNGEPKTITANASGAQSYKWTKNGEAIEGVENGELTVSWEKRSAGNTVDTYTVTPIYNVFGTEVEGTPKTVEVMNEPLGLMIIVR